MLSTWYLFIYKEIQTTVFLQLFREGQNLILSGLEMICSSVFLMFSLNCVKGLLTSLNHSLGAL